MPASPFDPTHELEVLDPNVGLVPVAERDDVLRGNRPVVLLPHEAMHESPVEPRRERAVVADLALEVSVAIDDLGPDRAPGLRDLTLPELRLCHAPRRVARRSLALVRRDVALRVAIGRADVITAAQPAGVRARHVGSRSLETEQVRAPIDVQDRAPEPLHKHGLRLVRIERPQQHVVGRFPAHARAIDTARFRHPVTLASTGATASTAKLTARSSSIPFAVQVVPVRT